MPEPTRLDAAALLLRTIVAQGACDLHLHTTASDGTTSPAELVQNVVANRLRAFSVTDHDTVAALPGVRAALDVLGANAPRFIPGVELSADFEIWPGKTIEVHLLGYFPLGGIEAVGGWLEVQRARRRERNARMCERLTQLGMPVTVEELEAEGAGVVGRVQAANILVRKGFAENRRDAFERFLNPGRPAYAPRERPSLGEAIGFLAGHGGISVLAHPHVYKWTGEATGLGERTLAEVLVQLRGLGLAGVEAFHGEATVTVRAEVLAAGLSAGLLITAGSDYHGGNKHAAMYTAETDFSQDL